MHVHKCKQNNRVLTVLFIATVFNKAKGISQLASIMFTFSCSAHLRSPKPSIALNFWRCHFSIALFIHKLSVIPQCHQLIYILFARAFPTFLLKTRRLQAHVVSKWLSSFVSSIPVLWVHFLKDKNGIHCLLVVLFSKGLRSYFVETWNEFKILTFTFDVFPLRFLSYFYFWPPVLKSPDVISWMPMSFVLFPRNPVATNCTREFFRRSRDRCNCNKPSGLY